MKNAYAKFTKKRNKVLENLHLKHQKLSATILTKLKIEVSHHVARWIGMGLQPENVPYVKEIVKQLYPLFDRAMVDTIKVYQYAAKQTHVLTTAATAEAVGRQSQKVAQYKIAVPTVSRDVRYRIVMYYNRILRDLQNRVELASLDPAYKLEDVMKAFPAPYEVKRPRNTLREAKKVTTMDEDAWDELVNGPEDIVSSFHKSALPNEMEMSSGYVSEEDWKQIVKDYTAEYIEPQAVFGRSGHIYDLSPADQRTWAEGRDTMYDWEVEKELTHDFVTVVRDSEASVFKQNGYNDFVWVAIVDDKTDECCLWRDGLTTKEIEAELSKHDDDCERTSVPPAHFNCRCTIVPFTDDEVQVDLPDYGDFDKWLND